MGLEPGIAVLLFVAAIMGFNPLAKQRGWRVPALVLNLVALGLLTFVPVGPELGPAVDRILRIFLSLLVVRHLVTGRSATRPAQQAEGPTTRAELDRLLEENRETPPS